MKTILGINHQFLYPDAIVDQKEHTESLKELSSFDEIDAHWLEKIVSMLVAHRPEI